MGQMPNDAAVRDAQIKLKKEECARDMGQRSKYLAKTKRDALMKSSKEECETRDKGKSMQMQRKVAQFMLRTEECAGDMRQMSKSIGMGQSGGLCIRHGAKIK